MICNFDALTKFIGDYAVRNKLPGVSVCINQNGGTIYNRGFGIKNSKTNAPIEGDTIFGIASMSKSITCLCIHILAHQGKLSLDEPVSRYLPKFSIPGTPPEAVTIRNLGEHNTGIPPLPILEWSLALNTPPEVQDAAYYDRLCATAKNKMATIDEMLEYIADPNNYTPLGAPGEQMSYSNECFGILCYIVDIASGQRFEDFARENIFEPLGMTRTTDDNDTAKSMGNITSLFSRRGDKLYCSDVWETWPPYRGCGVFKSTSQDMCNYYEMLACGGAFRGKTIVAPQVVETMFGGRYPEVKEGYYCQGLTKREFRGHVICEHSGGLKGVSSKGGFLAREGISAVVLCNEGSADVYPMLHACYNMLLDLPLDTHHCPHTPAEKQPADLSYYIGSYYCNEEEDSIYHVYPENGFLYARYNNDSTALKLLFCNTTVFLGTTEGKNPLDGGNFRFLVRNGKAWAVKIGSRAYQRLES